MFRFVPALALLAAPLTAAASEPVPPTLDKKTKDLVVSADLPFPAAVVWGAVAEDYGRIAESHPLIVRSDYRHGSLRGELGAERSCWFNDKGTRVLHEQIIGWDDEGMRMQNRVLEAAGFPLDPDNTVATYMVDDLGDGTSRLTFDMRFRAKPGFMTGMMAGQFEDLIQDYFVALEHHLATGEVVNRDNFKAIAKATR